MIPFSILDLAPVNEGQDVAAALRNARHLAQAGERLGYHRFWMAEHHSMPGIASAATAVALGHVAEGTQTIRIGAGGIMLPNHSPLQVAEQFGTLEALFPGRIDLGLGRAPGTDQAAAYAMRRSLTADVGQFPRDVLELQSYFRPATPGQRVVAVPGEGLDVPLWILGSSTYGAELAAELGLPYAFASHFAPDALHEAIALYRRDFTPSEQLEAPHLIIAANVIAADDTADAVAQFESTRRTRVRGMLSRGPATPEYDDDQIDMFLTTPEGRNIADMMRYSAVGTADEVRAYLEEFAEGTGADELILAHQSPSIEDRLRSVELTAGAMNLVTV